MSVMLGEVRPFRRYNIARYCSRKRIVRMSHPLALARSPFQRMHSVLMSGEQGNPCSFPSFGENREW